MGEHQGLADYLQQGQTLGANCYGTSLSLHWRAGLVQKSITASLTADEAERVAAFVEELVKGRSSPLSAQQNASRQWR